MAQNQQPEEDYEQLFEDAADLDDLPVSGDTQPGDEEPLDEEPARAPRRQSVQSRQQEEEPAQTDDGLDDDNFWEESAPLETPEPEQTPEQIEAAERARIRAGLERGDREARDFERRFGKPLFTPEEVKRRETIAEAVREVNEDTPEIALAIDEAVNRRLADIAPELAAQTGAMREEQSAEVHDATTTALAPSYPDFVENPQPLLAWIDELPAKFAEVYKDIVEQGTPAEVAGMIADFEAYPDPEDAIRALHGEEVESTQETQQPRPQSRAQSVSRRSNVPEAARAVRSRGTKPLPAASGAPVSDDFGAAYDEWRAIEREEERQSRAG